MNNWDNLCKEIEVIYNDLKELNDGNVADYIPQLSKVDPNLFGITAISTNNEIYNIGNTKSRFCIQSCSKPMTYLLALKEHGIEKVSKHIGREPSGKSFNNFELNSENKPHNPLINAGAIMAASLVKNNEKSDTRYDYIINEWKKLLNNDEISFDNSIYLSEKNSANRNYALSYLMMEKGIFPENTSIEETLQLYFQCCSITMKCEDLSRFAAILANSGKSLETGELLINPNNVKDILCVMYSSGMYDYSGRWSFEIGLPAKSGVSGTIFVVMPGIAGIAVYSPPLDAMGNSVRGVEFFKRLANKFNIHIFDTLVSGLEKKKNLTKTFTEQKINKIYKYCKENNYKNLEKIMEDNDSDVDINEGDYDSRTPLHIAVEEQNLESIQILINNNADPDIKDRWGMSPMEKANELKNDEIIKILQKTYIITFGEDNEI